MTPDRKKVIEYLNVSSERGNDDEKYFHVNTKKEIIQPILNDKQKRWLIVAPSESGKSYFIKELIKYSNIGKRDVVLFSPIEDDKSYSDVNGKLTRIEVNERLIEEPVELEELDNAIVIFDDVEAVEPAIAKVLDKLADDLYVRGRHKNIFTIKSCHVLLNSNKSRIQLLEADTIVVFPGAGANKQIRSYLYEYMGMKAEEINEYFKKAGRWLGIHKKAPNFVYSSNFIKLLC